MDREVPEHKNPVPVSTEELLDSLNDTSGPDPETEKWVSPKNYPNHKQILHKEGQACGQHFVKLLTEGAHINHIEVLMEDGMSEEAAVLSLLKAILDSAIWQTARYYVEESELAAQLGTGATGDKHCQYCRQLFTPVRGGQKYCCNACGHRADGLQPTVEHEDVCSTLKKAA